MANTQIYSMYLGRIFTTNERMGGELLRCIHEDRGNLLCIVRNQHLSKAVKVFVFWKGKQDIT